MSVISQFWLTLLEVIYLPIYNFFGYNSILSLIVLVLFIGMQIWVFWHFFFKPIIYMIKFILNLVIPNLFFKEVEVDEKTSKRC